MTKKMETEVSSKSLKAAMGRKVEVLAFGVSYVGQLKKVDIKNGTVRIEDKDDYVVLEIERIEDFRLLRR